MLVTAGDNTDRTRPEAAFAKMCGACPIHAGSGRTNGRHRLYRGGNRQANAALYRAVIVRMRSHQPTIDYVARRTAEASPSARSSGVSSATSSGDLPSTPATPRPAATRSSRRNTSSASSLTDIGASTPPQVPDRSLQDRAHSLPRPLAGPRRPGTGDPGVGGLVQRPPAAQCLRQRPPVKLEDNYYRSIADLTEDTPAEPSLQ